MLSFLTWTDLERAVEAGIPEGPSLEYKREISLSGRRDRIEMLKDLTGMANGGGGSVVFGVEEDADREGIPAQIVPIADEAMIGVLEDIVRSSVRPPLLARYRVLRDESGSAVLVVDVNRSELGPFMVEAYDQRRYSTRVGRSTEPMSEQQVRDAYTLAARSREERDAAWERHVLPFLPGTGLPWLAVSGLPLGPLNEIFDPRAFILRNLTGEEVKDRMRIHADLAGLSRSTSALHVWSDGIYGDDDYGEGKGASHIFRLHRDGAALVASKQDMLINRWNLARELNADFAYLGWLWDKVDLRIPVELDIRLVNFENVEIIVPNHMGFETKRQPIHPDGARVPSCTLRREVLVQDLNRAPMRHDLVKEFSDRFHQAFGITEQPYMFTQGWLYTQDAGFLRISAAGRGVFDETGSEIAIIDKRGGIASRSGDIVAWLVDGVILDNEGGVVAACELAPGSGLPDDFAIAGNIARPLPIVAGGNPGSPVDVTHEKDPPAPGGRWSPHSLQQLVSGS